MTPIMAITTNNSTNVNPKGARKVLLFDNTVDLLWNTNWDKPSVTPLHSGIIRGPRQWSSHTEKPALHLAIFAKVHHLAITISILRQHSATISVLLSRCKYQAPNGAVSKSVSFVSATCFRVRPSVCVSPIHPWILDLTRTHNPPK